MKAQTMRRVRQLHNYVALFFAPAIIFFAFSGALQTLGLHESHDPARPPIGWVQWIASVHKDQRVPAAQTPARPAHAPGGDHHDGPPRETGPSPVPLKAFVTLLALGLIISSGLGVTIALNNPLTRRTSLALLSAGTILPILLLFV